MSDRLYFEQKVAVRLGISRPDIKYLRDEVLKKKTGWLLHGRDVVYTQAGLDALLAHLRASSSEIAPDFDFSSDQVPLSAPEKKKEPEAQEEGFTSTALEDRSTKKNEADEADALVELTVHRVYPNPRILAALTPAGVLVDVQVRTNVNFVPRMKLHGRMVRPGRYMMEGRCPRFKGRY